MVTWVVGGNMARNNDDCLVPVVEQQAVLYSASASIDNVGDDKSTGRRLAYALARRRPNDDNDDGDIVLSSSHIATPSLPFVSRVAMGA